MLDLPDAITLPDRLAAERATLTGLIMVQLAGVHPFTQEAALARAVAFVLHRHPHVTRTSFERALDTALILTQQGDPHGGSQA